MKHFHYTNEKTRLAHEIYNLTTYLEGCEKERKNALVALQDPTTRYETTTKLSKRIYELTKEITKSEAEINSLQSKHDLL